MFERETIAGNWPGVLAVWHDRDIARIEVEHDGSIGWDALQAIKNAVWGEEAQAIEIYPAQGHVVNGGNYRHLWLCEGMELPSLIDEGSRAPRPP